MGLAAGEWLGRGGLAFAVGVLTASHGARAVQFALGGRFVRHETYRWHGHDLPESIYFFNNLQEPVRLA